MSKKQFAKAISFAKRISKITEKKAGILMQAKKNMRKRAMRKIHNEKILMFS